MLLAICHVIRYIKFVIRRVDCKYLFFYLINSGRSFGKEYGKKKREIEGRRNFFELEEKKIALKEKKIQLCKASAEIEKLELENIKMCNYLKKFLLIYINIFNLLGELFAYLYLIKHVILTRSFFFK